MEKEKHCKYIGKELVCLTKKEWQELKNFYFDPLVMHDFKSKRFKKK